MPVMSDRAAQVAAAYREVYGARERIPLHEPSFRGAEVRYCTECVESGWVSSAGAFVTRLQEDMVRFTGSRFAVATVNGTAGLHLALIVTGVERGDEVLCPDVTFVATAAAIVHAGASPVFVDIDEDTLGMSPSAVEAFLAECTEERDGRRVNRATGRPVTACVVMHNVGFPARVQALQDVCARYGVPLVEDAAEALGSRIDDRMCGTFGVVGVYSFNGNKLVTTGGGGMLVTDAEDRYELALHLSTTAKVPHPYRYIHDAVGYNYRMPNINAALGVAQLEYIEDTLATKRQQREQLQTLIPPDALEVLTAPHGCQNDWFVVGRLSEGTVEAFIEDLDREGVMARPLWSRVSQMAPYRDFEARPMSVAERVVSSVVCLPNGVA